MSLGKTSEFYSGIINSSLRYNPQGRGFDSQWCHWNFSLTYNHSSLTMALGLTQSLTEMSTTNFFWV